MEEHGQVQVSDRSPAPNRSRHRILFVLVIMVIVLGGVSIYYWYRAANYVITEDAYIDGTIAKVTPQISARLVEFSVREGQEVVKGEILGRQEDLAIPSGANSELVLLRAPVSGMVLKVDGTVGEMVVPGRTLVWIADPKSLYVTANIEETDLHKIKPGQLVEFTVDSFPGVKFSGWVTEIGQATLSTFSLLPARTTEGTFTKVVQRVPVKILINNMKGFYFRPGLNAVVKIYIR